MAETLTKFVKKRAAIKSKLTKFSNFFHENKSKPEKISEVSKRFRDLKPLLSEFEDVQLEIQLLDDSDATVAQEEADIFENNYYMLITEVEDLITKTSTQQNPLSTGQASNSSDDTIRNISVRLPTLELPKFDGSLKDYASFYDSFDSLINKNPDLTDIQKFQYLKSCLTDQAGCTIESVTVTADNYKVALELLKDRYENKRLITHHHLHSLFNLPNITKDPRSLRVLYDTVTSNIKALNIIKRPTEHWDDLIIYLITLRFDSTTAAAWEMSITGNELPSMKDMYEFLKRRCQFLETLEFSSANKSQITNDKYNKQSTFVNKQSANHNNSFRNTYNNYNKGLQNKIPQKTFVASQGSLACALCKGNHHLYQCQDFLGLSPSRRFDIAKEHKLCVNCLKGNHATSNCLSGTCKKCNKRHNTLLHFETPKPITETANPETSSVANLCHKNDTSSSQVLLSTAIILVQDIRGNWNKCRCLIDVGSQSNFITTSCHKRLGLPSQTINMPITGINQVTSNVNCFTNIKFKSTYNSYSSSMSCLILQKITENLPLYSFSSNQIQIPSGILLADPDFNISSPIDILIGAELFWQFLSSNQIKPTYKGQPYFHETQLGWIIGGKISNNVTKPPRYVCNHSVNNLEQQVCRFWEIEEPVQASKFSPEEQACEEHYVQNYQRNSEGRYVVSLPFKQHSSELGSSREIAEHRFLSLERRFQSNPILKQEYTHFINEYIKLGHMEVISDKEVINKPHVYLPHHAVIKDASPSTKLRVVFDASCKTASGLCLNDVLMVGPTIQQDVFSIVTRLRTYQYVLMADIKMMFRQIMVKEEDTNFQLILWREDSEGPFKTYRLKTVTYGTACAPFLAVRTLNQLAVDEQTNYPLAATVINRDFYMDDLLTGCDSLQSAQELKTQLIQALSIGGFQLCKFASNSSQLLSDLDESENPLAKLDREKDIKMLGISWNSISDSFKYNININFNLSHKVTKRSVLSTIASIFDPLGLISPCLIQSKLILQQLWSLQLQWDEEIPENLKTMFIEYIKQLPNLSNHHIPRKVITNESNCLWEIHGFSDSSMLAYGAAVYVRTITKSGKSTVNLLCSKSRVAPLKSTTLPRLELCGALLLTRLMSRVRDSLAHLNIDYFYWTDSTIVLSWLSEPAYKWQTYVANRVSEIQSLSSISQWQHVKSKDNPADIISRGMSPDYLVNSNLWWYGPDNLTACTHSWSPQNINHIINKSEENERRKIIQVMSTTVSNPEFSFFQKYSSLNKLIRVMAYCKRFVNILKHKPINPTLTITIDEINDALLTVIKSVQTQYFAQEITLLSKGQSIPSSSKLISLSPFLDDRGLLRCGGRLSNSCMSLDKKHPILLPKGHHVTRLIIENEHVTQLHAGTEATLAAVREKYWPISGRSMVKQIIHKCIKCFKANNPSTVQQIMGDLPSARVQSARPFINCGVDYAGPIFIKESRHRGKAVLKSYIALFICMSTKAVHLELISDCTTEAFLAALKRMTSRRGKCLNIFSDNASTFVGADRELQRLLKGSEFQRTLLNKLNQEGIQWHFIPPRSPNFGGLWEANIKSVKRHLKKVAANALLTFEEMCTLLTSIEACLNSRPITPLSSDPHDLQPLTPGHFLIGSAITAPVEEDLKDLPTNRLSRWQRVQQISQHFWKRWSREYLSTQQQRSKWRFPKGASVQIGSMVLLQEDNTAPLVWPLGRITQLHPGKDGIVRVVSIKTKGGTVKRGINKISVLPVEVKE